MIIPGVDLEIRDSHVHASSSAPRAAASPPVLRCIAGLEDITSRLYIGGELVNSAAGKPGIAMVFQSYALYPP